MLREQRHGSLQRVWSARWKGKDTAQNLLCKLKPHTPKRPGLRGLPWTVDRTGGLMGGRRRGKKQTENCAAAEAGRGRRGRGVAGGAPHPHPHPASAANGTKHKVKRPFSFLQLACCYPFFKLSSDMISILKLSLTLPHQINSSFIDIPTAF